MQILPPFKPQVESETDTRYFDQEFTGESVLLTPPNQTSAVGTLSSITEGVELPYFQQFSYHGSESSLAMSFAGQSHFMRPSDIVPSSSTSADDSGPSK